MYKVYPTHSFERIRNKLKKKYPRIEQDYTPLVEKLKKGVFEGDEVQGFSGLVYKVRIGSVDQKKGKRGGFRIIYYLVTPKKTIYLLTIYPKTMRENIQPGEIRAIIERLG